MQSLVRLTRKRLLLPALLVLSLAPVVAVDAQTRLPHHETQTILLTGIVYDLNGALVVDGRVVAGDAFGKQYSAQTNSEGVYSMRLPLAIYRVEASAPGFCRTRIERFRVVNSTYGKMALDFALELPGSDQHACDEAPSKKNRRRGQARTTKNVAD